MWTDFAQRNDTFLFLRWQNCETEFQLGTCVKKILVTPVSNQLVSNPGPSPIAPFSLWVISGVYNIVINKLQIAGNLSWWKPSDFHQYDKGYITSARVSRWSNFAIPIKYLRDIEMQNKPVAIVVYAAGFFIWKKNYIALRAQYLQLSNLSAYLNFYTICAIISLQSV